MGNDGDRVVELAEDTEPLLPEQTSDDTAAGWGERPEWDSNDSRLEEDRPPHWGE